MRFKTKPVEIEAIQFKGGDNFAEVHQFTEGPEGKSQFAWTTLGEGEEVRLADERDEFQAQVYDYLHDTWVNVKVGQYIIKGTKGEFYPCDPEVFEAKYEAIPEPPKRTPEPPRRLAPPSSPHSSSADAIVRGAEHVWGELAGDGGLITSNIPHRNPEHRK